MRPLVPSLARLSGQEVGEMLRSCMAHVEEAQLKLETKKSEMEGQIYNMSRNKIAEDGTEDSLRPLHGTCVKPNIMQYECEHCAFDLVRHYEHVSDIAVLDRFHRLSVQNGVSFVEYRNGDRCCNGPVRSIEVQLL